MPESSPVPGREESWARLTSVLDEAASGHSRIVAVQGEPGIGKTTLLGALRDHASGAGFRVLSTRGSRTDREIGFASLLTLLRPVEDQLGELAGEFDDDLRAALTLGARRSVDDLAVRLAVHRLITTLADSEPLLLVVDDASHLDGASAAVLAFAIGRLTTDPVVTVLGTDEPVTKPFEALDHSTLVLGGLPPDVLDALVHREGPIAEEVAGRCCDLAAGNPLVALELVRALDDEERSGAAPPAPVPRPPAGLALAQSYTARLAELSDAARRALVVVAADDTGRLAIVRDALARLSEDPAVLDEAEAEGLLRLESGNVRLSHPLLRSVAYHQVAAGSRRAAHTALAAALDEPDDAVARAWQLAAAADGPDETAAEALELVARDVRRRGGAASAARVLERAALLSPDVGARHDRSLAAAEAWLDAGDPARARAAVPPSRPVEPSEIQLTRVVEVVRWAENPSAALQRLREDDHPPGTPWARALEADLLLDVSGAGAALEAATTAKADADMAGESLATRLAGSVAVRAGAGEPDGPDRADAALEQSPLDPRHRLVTLRMLQARAEAGLVDDLSPTAMPTSGVEAAVARAQASRHEGRVSAAFDQLFAEHALLPERAGRRRAVLEVWLADSAHLLGREPDARAHLAHVATLPPGELGAPGRAAADWMEGRLALSSGEVAPSLTSLESAAGTLPHLYAPELIVAFMACGRSSDAGRWLERIGGSTAEHPIARTRADRARGAFRGDVDLFQRSIQTAVDCRLPIEAAESRLALAEHLTRAGRAADARRAGEAATRDFAALGIAGWASRLATVTEAAASAGPSVQAELTAAEYRVAVTVAEGGRNREVAEKLFLSVKTVDFHLQNIYRKLGLRSRTELAVRLSRDDRTVAERESTP